MSVYSTSQYYMKSKEVEMRTCNFYKVVYNDNECNVQDWVKRLVNKTN